MRKLILATAASVVITAASLLPVGGAQAMTPGTASGVHAAIAQTSPIESVRCWRRCFGCPLICRGYYGGGYGPLGRYGGYPGVYGGYGPPVGVYGGYPAYYGGVGPRWGW